MNFRLKRRLAIEIRKGSYAGVRNLAWVEANVLRGQFNVAKVLRAAAHTQRILALEAARLLEGRTPATEQLRLIELEMVEPSSSLLSYLTDGEDPALWERLERYQAVQERLKNLVQRSLTSLEGHPDVLESDVPQFLWGCYNCGYLAEGSRPEVCPCCGAFGVESEGFGPFYATTPEHLGRLSPLQIEAVLAAIPSQVAGLLQEAADEALQRKPSPDEWCIKEIIGHLIETDLLFDQRVRAVLEGQGLPTIPRVAPPWKLHEGKGYEKLPAVELLARLDGARAANLELISSLQPEQWSRQGLLQSTPTSVHDLGVWLANHDQGHVAQIQRLLETYR